jgi:predicted dienelactone hydrolase
MANRGRYGVGVTTLSMVDASRPTVANRSAPAQPDRRMDVEVWYPAVATEAAPEDRAVAFDRSGGRYPLIIFAHGLAASSRQSVEYTTELASHGYIVAAPGFPQSRIDSPGGPRLAAVLDQPADVSFVIDQMLKLNRAQDGLFAGTIDEDRIGMTGHSLGGLTTMLTAHGSGRDVRIKVIAPISPVGCLLGASLVGDASIPTMVIGGSIERVVEPATIRGVYDAARAPKYDVEIIGADHARFADVDIMDTQLGADIVSRVTGGDVATDSLKIAAATGADVTACVVHNDAMDTPITGERQRELLRIVATPFFDAYLKGDPGAMRFLTETLPTLDGIRFKSETAP